MATLSKNSLCEHGEVPAACLDCLAQPKKVKPRPAATIRATKNPSSAKDKISPLAGEMDVSLPVDAVGPFVGQEFIPVRVFPHYLKKSGWIYLRCDGRLQARVKAKKVVWQDTRIDPQEDSPLGAGIAIEVDPLSWDKDLTIELGNLAKAQQDGFRYLKTHSDNTITHYRGTKAVDQSEIDLTGPVEEDI